MKFFGQSDGSAPHKRCLPVKIMSLFIFLFMSVGGVSAANPPVTIHLKNVTVAELLRQIEAQGKYSFAYNNADIDLTRVVSVAAEAWPIERIVLKCIPDVLVNVERNKVILTPRRGAQVSPPRKISGKVADASGNPVVGATILLKDGEAVRGTSSGASGTFAFDSFSLSDKAALEVSFIGFDTYKTTVGVRTFSTWS